MKKNNKKLYWGIALLILFIFVGTGLFMYFSPLTQGITGVSDLFVNPDWARLECSPTDGYEVDNYAYLNNQQIFKCNGFTDECELFIYNKFTSDLNIQFGVIAGSYKECGLDGVSNCGITKTYTIQYRGQPINLRLPEGKSLVFLTGLLIKGEEKTQIELRYKPYKLYRYVGGSKFIVNSENCDITSSSKSNILKSELPSTSKLYRQGGQGTKWLNYVNAWNYAPATNVFIHPNYGKVYCNAGQIFSIVKLELADGSLKEINPKDVSEKEDGTIVSGQGQRLSFVDCCPNEPNCDSNFEFTNIIEEKSCFTDSQCFNNGEPTPISQTQYVLYKCVSNKCIKSDPINVECTTTAGCPSGMVCDLSNTNYGKCIQQKPGDYCGDSICGINENKNTCPSDCGEDSTNGTKICNSCDDFVVSQMLGAFIKSKDCKAKTILTIPTQNNTICFLSWIKYSLVPIVFMVLLFLGLFFSRSLKDKVLRIVAIISTIIISIILSILVFFTFYVALALIIVAIIGLIVLNAILP